MLLEEQARNRLTIEAAGAAAKSSLVAEAARADEAVRAREAEARAAAAELAEREAAEQQRIKQAEEEQAAKEELVRVEKEWREEAERKALEKVRLEVAEKQEAAENAQREAAERETENKLLAIDNVTAVVVGSLHFLILIFPHAYFIPVGRSGCSGRDFMLGRGDACRVDGGRRDGTIFGSAC